MPEMPPAAEVFAVVLFTSGAERKYRVPVTRTSGDDPTSRHLAAERDLAQQLLRHPDGALFLGDAILRVGQVAAITFRVEGVGQ